MGRKDNILINLSHNKQDDVAIVLSDKTRPISTDKHRNGGGHWCIKCPTTTWFVRRKKWREGINRENSQIKKHKNEKEKKESPRASDKQRILAEKIFYLAWK